MIVRIDTTNITRGREFTLYAKNSGNDTVITKAVDVVTGDVHTIHTTHESNGAFDGYTGVAPSVDGFFFGKVGRQKVVKKIGFPPQSFAIAYMENYTVEYVAFSSDGLELTDGTLVPIGDGFYYTILPNDTAVVNALGKNFIVNKDLLKMNYEITMDGGSLNSTFDGFSMDNVSLPSIELPDATLGNAELDSTLPNIEIKEL